MKIFRNLRRQILRQVPIKTESISEFLRVVNRANCSDVIVQPTRVDARTVAFFNICKATTWEGQPVLYLSPGYFHGPTCERLSKEVEAAEATLNRACDLAEALRLQQRLYENPSIGVRVVEPEGEFWEKVFPAWRRFRIAMVHLLMSHPTSQLS